MRTIIGVDIGGSHISAAQINWNSGSIQLSNFYEADVDTSGSVDEIIDAWSEVIKKVANGKQAIQLGIAMPGPFDYEQGISLIQEQGKLKSLYGLSVKDLLAQSISIDSEFILFMNDAEAFLRGESMVGAGKKYNNLMGLTLGTGLGSAIQVEEVVKDAKLWTAPFRDGIAEDYLGTAWFIGEVKKQYGLEIEGVKDLLMPEVNSEISRSIFQKFGNSLGEFLFPYVSRLHTESVIVGGKISNASKFFLPFTQSYLQRMGLEVSCQKSELGENATLIGAAQPFL
ncbi:ROK family protein [Algoriphagus sp. NBT04N3]|jgi:glucokinase|uniref:ROK family protein n=1 Tax=Algoriphagus sp. NBT04N3 TaxID=2705473 RepID=UPI001C637BA5|nr:ROK family protein [Algoriphagus sp. NBT04N3]QYH38100.1 ROK family protein [Algoriphagus sp. NBT04N3]